MAPGDPFAVGTFSGISRGLLGALDDRGALVGAVDGFPPWRHRLEQVASFDPDRRRWRQRFHGGISPLSPLVREAMSAVAGRRATRATAGRPVDVVLQLTGWYRPAVAGALRASYHDGNLATFLARPDTLVARDSPTVLRLLGWERRLYDRTPVIFTMSEWLRRSFVEDFGQAPDKVVTVGAGSDLPDVPVAERSWQVPRFVFVGREFERKGGRELLAAWPAVRRARPDAELVLVGPREMDGPLPPGVTLAGRIDRSTPAGTQRFLDVYRHATAFVLPSLYEPFGIVFLEAMTHGLPCVAADRCAMPEIVADGVTGRIADPGDPDALARAMLDVSDPALAARMGAAGRARVRERFTWAAVADRILAELARRLA